MTDVAAAAPPPAPPAAKKAAGPSKFVKVLQKIYQGRVAGFLLLIALVAVMRGTFELTDTLRMRVFDFYHQLQPNKLGERLKAANLPERFAMVVDIDEDSLAAIGQWPWSRATVARLLEAINRYQVPTVGFDIVFAEADRLSPPRLAETLGADDAAAATTLKALPDTDEVFAEVLKRSRAVLGQAAFGKDLPHQTEAPIKTPIAEIGGDPRPNLLNFPAIVRNIPVLEQAAQGRGMFSVNPERDGIVRRVPAVLSSRGDIYPTLAFEMLRVATGQNAIGVRRDLAGINAVIIPRVKVVPTDKEGRLLLHYAPHDPARYVSAKDVLAGSPAAEALRGRFVLVGTSAEGLKDIRATPIDSGIPGVEIHAMIIESVLTDSLLSRPAEFLALEILALIAAGLLILGLTGIVRAQWTLLLFVVLAGGFAATSWWLFTEKKMLLDAALPAAGVFLVYSVVTYASYAREEASKRQVRDAFGRYLSPALVEQLADNPDKLRLGGEMRPMTLMFSDVRGFTTISETFKSNPEGLTRLINRFLSPTTNVILQHRGTIDKYMGDAIMAFWNAPLDDAGHAANACRAALAMFIEMDKLNAELNAEAKAEGREAKELHIGIGINSGICCVGNMGSHQRFDYSVLGDTVNLASRLEGQSKTYHVGTVVGEGARNLVQDMAFLELDLIAVKGKKEAVRIFTLLGDRDVLESSRFQAVEPRHAAMLVAFRGQKWDEAKALCAECAKLWPDLAEFYGLYLERIAEYEANPPPPNWDGVFVATSK